MKGEYISINLIAKFYEINGMENYIIYKPLKLSNININDIDINKNETNDINEKNKIIPTENEKNLNLYFIFKFFIILLIIIFILILCLYFYKIIRRNQINKIVDTLIENKNEKSFINNFNYNEDDFNIKRNDEINFNSKISYIIESL